MNLPASSAMLSYAAAALVLSLSLFPIFSHGAPPPRIASDTNGSGSELISERDDMVGFLTETETKFVTLTVTSTHTVTLSSATPTASSEASVSATPAVADVNTPVTGFAPQPATNTSNSNTNTSTAPPKAESNASTIAVTAATLAQPLIMAYYPDWAPMDPSKIDFKFFDWIDFAFAVPTADFDLTWDDPKAPGMLRKLVSAAHGKGTKVKLSIGGWSGSR